MGINERNRTMATYDPSSKKVYRKLGGKQKFQSVLDRICKAHNLMRITAGEICDEDEKPYATSIVFEYSSAINDCLQAYHNFEEARIDVCYILSLFGLTLNFEWYGDGNGALMSYRIGYMI